MRLAIYARQKVATYNNENRKVQRRLLDLESNGESIIVYLLHAFFQEEQDFFECLIKS